MSSEQHPAPAMSEGTLRNFLKRAIKRGYYKESFHAEAEHPERGLSVDDVLHGLERDDWKFAKPPDYDAKYGCWEYLIRTVDIGGDELHVKIAVHAQVGRFEVITRW